MSEAISFLVKQVFLRKGVYLFDGEVSLICPTKQIGSKQFLISEDRTGIITEPLTVELQRRPVNITDIHIYFYKF